METEKNNLLADYDERFMKMAAKLSLQNIDSGGGPFAAVIVRDGEVIATGVNSVTRDNDPTAHAEVSAIRNACHRLQRFNLYDCVIYSSCEPCPMCLSAIYWAGLKKLFYGNTKEDAEAIDFSDKFIYEEITRPPMSRHIPGIKVDSSDTICAFKHWEAKQDKIKY